MTESGSDKVRTWFALLLSCSIPTHLQQWRPGLYPSSLTSETFNKNDVPYRFVTLTYIILVSSAYDEEGNEPTTT